MSRIGKRVLEVPTGVTVTVEDGIVKVTGSKGTLEMKLYEGLTQDMGKRSLKKWKDRKPRDNDNEISPAQVVKIQLGWC